jgi:hypothetical protein
MKLQAHNEQAPFSNQMFAHVDQQGVHLTVGAGAGPIHSTAIANGVTKPTIHARIANVAEADVLNILSSVDDSLVTVRMTTATGEQLWLNMPGDSVDLLVEVLREAERQWAQKQTEKQMDTLETAGAV